MMVKQVVKETVERGGATPRNSVKQSTGWNTRSEDKDMP